MSLPGPPPSADLGSGPVVFEGFRTLYTGPYLGYARVHLGTRRAADAVRSTFDAVACEWSTVVSSSNPTAAGWAQLVAHTGSRLQPLPVPAHSPLEYDAMVLHHVLGYTVGMVADVVGDHPSKINYLVGAWPTAGDRPAIPPPPRPKAIEGGTGRP